LYLTHDITPERVKALSFAEKSALCNEIRKLLISVVSTNGGHLASNLGTVELIVAMHSVFNSPVDKFIFDVGHQAYTHKILTGRLSEFEKLRQEGGLSGFPRPSESEHDAFIGGHSSISVSAGLGIAAAKSLKGEDGNVVVVAGDGAFTGGEIYEGLNNAGKNTAKPCKTNGNLIVILNDNQMCISKSSGALAAYLSQIRTKGYYETKNRVKKALNKTALGKKASGAIGETKRIIKGALISNNLFENLGFKYFGPIDGHNIEELVYNLELVKTIDAPCLVHVKTKKGKGYIPAEENAGHYHGIGASRAPVPDCTPNTCTYSEVFGKEITRLGEENEKICLITAAMKYATGSNYFAKRFPERFFDTGIAEAHSATFAAGLASGGLTPVFAVYSTFMQRCFDQFLHDASIEKLRMVLAIDRAGLSGEDGPTHQGTFDVGLLSLVPDTTIYSPLTAEELRVCLKKAIYDDSGISAVRYPRGIAYNHDEKAVSDYALYKNRNRIKSEKLIITYGRIAKNALRLIENGYNADVLRLVRINPISDMVCDIISCYNDVIFFEEGSLKGGIAEKISAMLAREGAKIRFRARGVEGFMRHADLERQLKLCGFDLDGMRDFVFNG